MLKNTFYVIVCISLAISIIFSGCSTKTVEKKTPLQTVKPHSDEAFEHAGLNRVMYVSETLAPFVRGEEVQILDFQGTDAITEKGKIPLAFLEKNPSKVSLTVKAPDGAKVRIMSIKPKYHDGIYLKPGPYLLEVTKPGYKKMLEWVVVRKNTTLEIGLKKAEHESNVSFSWNKKNFKTYHIDLSSVALIGSAVWHDAEHANLYRWEAGQKVCGEIALPLSDHYRIDTFALPEIETYEAIKESVQLFKNTDLGKYEYWTSDAVDRENIERTVPASREVLSDKAFDEKYGNHRMQLSFYNRDNRLSHFEFRSRPETDYSNIMCVSERNNFNDMPLDDLQEMLYANFKAPLSKSEKNRQSAQEAFHLKYGKPQIQNVTCNRHSCRIDMTSERNGLALHFDVPTDEKDFDMFSKAVHNMLQPDLSVVIFLSGDKPEVQAIDGLQDSKSLVMAYRLEEAWFSVEKLRGLMDAAMLDDELSEKAQARIFQLRALFHGYEPGNDLVLEGCHYYYPQNLIDVNTKKSLGVAYWDEISGKAQTCENGLLQGKTTLYFFSEKGVYVKLKGEMENGLFHGAVTYEKSRDPNHEAFTGDYVRKITVKEVGEYSDYHASRHVPLQATLQ